MSGGGESLWRRHLPTLIVGGAMLGVATGLAIGPRAAVLEPLGLAYARALEIAVIPYLICSLIGGLGALARARMRRLLGASWPPYLIVWSVTLAAILMLGLAFPKPPAPAFLEHHTIRFGLVDMLIPSNLAESLHHNFVPAIVVFGFLYGLAIQPLPQKAALLDIVEVLRKASATLWSWVIYLAPVGVFALFADIAGTVSPGSLGGLAVYVGLFLAGTFLLAFVTFPWLLSRIAPLRYGEILRELRPALVLALVTTLSAVTLPYIQAVAERFARREGLPEEEASDVARIALTIGYVLSQLGNYFIALFILYIAHHGQHPLSVVEMALLPVMTLLSGIGSPSGTLNGVAFLSGWLGLHGDPTDLYVETMTITRYGQVLLSVIGFSFVTFLTMLLFFGRARIVLRTLLLPLGLTFALIAATSLAGRMLEDRFATGAGAAALQDRRVAPHHRGPHSVMPAGSTAAPMAGAGRLDDIHERGRLRIGFLPDHPPFSYLDRDGLPAGFDIAAAHRLARDLEVHLELHPIAPVDIAPALDQGRLDIVVGGLHATEERLRAFSLSDFYYDSPLVLVAEADMAPDLLSYADLAGATGLRLAVVERDGLMPLATELFPRARIEVADTFQPGLDDEIAGLLAIRVTARAWTLAHPGFTAVQPHGLNAAIPFAFLMPRGSDALARRINLWLDLEQAQGIWESEVGYWIEGRSRRIDDRRWNLLDDILLPWLHDRPAPASGGPQSTPAEAGGHRAIGDR